MTTNTDAAAGSLWRRILPQLALCVPELGVALGFGFLVFVGAMALGCRALYPVCDSAGGLAIVVFALVASILFGSGYLLVALGLGLRGHRRTRYALDGIVAAVALSTYITLQWRARNEEAQARASVAAGERSAAAAREVWIAELRQNPDAHGPPGIVPPMLQVVDSGQEVEVTNTASEWLVVALARVRADAQAPGGWRACPLLTVGEISDYYRFSIGPSRTARYAPLRECAAGFDGALLEYRVGDPVPNATGWWSDSAFAAPEGRLP